MIQENVALLFVKRILLDIMMGEEITTMTISLEAAKDASLRCAVLTNYVSNITKFF